MNGSGGMEYTIENYRNYAMLEALAAKESDERVGMRNTYICEKCQAKVHSVVRNNGVTPNVITCVEPGCGGTSLSQEYCMIDRSRVDIAWVRARNLEEILEWFAEQLDGVHPVQYIQSVKNLISWWQGCGLFMRKI